MYNIGKKIKQLRIRDNMSADQLAQTLGKSGLNKKQFTYDLEKGRIKRIDLETLTKIASTFNVNLSYFIDESLDGVKTASNKIAIDDKTIEAGWKEKYLEVLKENSDLKSKIIELMQSLKD